jgi:hypothetical protein
MLGHSVSFAHSRVSTSSIVAPFLDYSTYSKPLLVRNQLSNLSIQLFGRQTHLDFFLCTAENKSLLHLVFPNWMKKQGLFVNHVDLCPFDKLYDSGRVEIIVHTMKILSVNRWHDGLMIWIIKL